MIEMTFEHELLMGAKPINSQNVTKKLTDFLKKMENEYNLSDLLYKFIKRLNDILMGQKTTFVQFRKMINDPSAMYQDNVSYHTIISSDIDLNNYLTRACTLLQSMISINLTNEELFTVLFGSTNPDGEQLKKRLKILLDLTGYTISPLLACLKNRRIFYSTNGADLYLFKDELAQLYMLVNVIRSARGHVFAEHIYIHRAPSKVIQRWLTKTHDSPLAKGLHKYAMMVIQPDYVVSAPLSAMDPIFSSLVEDGYLQQITGREEVESLLLDLYHKTKFIPNDEKDNPNQYHEQWQLLHFRRLKTCEATNTIFKVIKTDKETNSNRNVQIDEESIQKGGRRRKNKTRGQRRRKNMRRMTHRK
jgi:hypothetical protein